MDTRDLQIADAASSPAAGSGVRTPSTDVRRLLRQLGMRALVAVGVMRRLVVRPARLFHGKAEADRMRDQRDTQRLNARHFRGM